MRRAFSGINVLFREKLPFKLDILFFDVDRQETGNPGNLKILWCFEIF